ncbi:protein FAM234A [Ornithorhynchus anatinus]|uniref:Family with sequence similarity 234 member A n=1 Tax=Ornithorhynchus anatinus TaxID=9258 RepID=F7DFH4_ORNAN|nr:protein FAM234A [Ornithorhynchus anatinus]XP_028905091.1 protein FAM234A [Ornithorhynchus anatinus]XP_028905092.1 protein FAM234A [Ornithorhynchus anatinus]XP_028905093.1 protein FAM234A [Ornithorhynchus anatinus]XP_028905094.1 protein FAM234A [Ornithorhynchus anatinus]
MMENKDLEAEIHPLKSEEGKAQPSQEAGVEKKQASGKVVTYTRVSPWRTAAFFLSLFSCLFTVLLLSFILPCPIRQRSEKTWRRDYNVAVTYDFLALEDVNMDKVQDVLFLYKGAHSDGEASNHSCGDVGLDTPCAFAVAASGTNGALLWQRPIAQDVTLTQCAIPQLGATASPGCLVAGEPRTLTAFDPQTGETRWTGPISFGANASMLRPFLETPDADGDGARDLLFFAREDDEIKSSIHSGKTGQQIGSKGSLGLRGDVGYVLHVTKSGAYYVVFHSASFLYGYSLKDLYDSMTGTISELKKDPSWEKMIHNVTHRLPVLSSRVIQFLVKLPVEGGENLLVVKSDGCDLLDGEKLVPLWTLNATGIMREPILGYYKPDMPAIALEDGAGNRRKILIVDSSSGSLLWSCPLKSDPRTPRSATLQTADHRSAFFFWGSEQLASANGTEPSDLQSLYMFHPTFPTTLLELANVTDNIVAFEAVLFERSRHACYVLLTGPPAGAGPGPVTLLKRKVKEDILTSRVVQLGQEEPEGDKAIRDRFYRMRYRSPA